ncbi:MAG: YidC/Oxa1 family membrane protein insertase [Clostridia bacterium]|nr:YidC/Oxa1 family membrane protein insertase [Clostridia bacterium]
MNLFSLISGVAAPKGLWEILLRWINGAIGNLGWTLLLLTILVKLVTTPLDFMVKYTTKKQTLVQQKCAPQIAKLRKKFGNNEQAIRTQTTSLYKREGLKMGTGCLMMLINMILTCVIFFTFYSSLRKVSAYEAIHQYEQIEVTYTDAYFNAMADYKADDEFTTAEQAKTWVETLEDLQKNDPESNELKEMELFVTSNEALFVYATDKACEAAKEKWNEVNESWLWVNNIWVADATTKPFQSYDSLKKTADNAGKYYKEYVTKNIDKDEYTIIANYISSSSNVKHNGYYILAILAGVITFAQQLITDFHTKLRNKKANKLAKATNKQNQMSLKVMKIIMPIIMVSFVLTSSASFGIYILASNVASIAFGEIIALIVNKLTRKQQEEVEAELAKEAERLIKKGQLQE